MNKQDKFEDFKDEIIAKNEKKYGEEIRKKYGNDTVNKSNAKIKGMTEEKMREAEKLRLDIENKLKEAFESGDTSGEAAKEVCEMHRRWLNLYWPDGVYSKEAHMGLADMYVSDARFSAYYDKIAPGCAEFLREAVYEYCK